jgi:hypothetical protein
MKNYIYNLLEHSEEIKDDSKLSEKLKTQLLCFKNNLINILISKKQIKNIDTYTLQDFKIVHHVLSNISYIYFQVQYINYNNEYIEHPVLFLLQ